ncbi:MarR family winged helix-turn-helix transcriptional regulator [Amycolatopsis anabasis]|uniref:MarR family winged helix-turn-helix transcriptional regulator n=1 Tax=Amycolatopsis anabasis TaxID=1840409 RepID=UPI00131BA6E1|nr:MarR family winged helix-turn-helix transcriptional regulator [Amycolatopsis anabasis]
MASEPRSKRALHESPAFRLTVLGTHLAGDFAEHLRAAELTPKHLGVLTVVDQGFARTQDDVARLMRVSPSLVVRLIDHLEQRDLIGRRRDPGNRRRHILSVTAQGKTVIDKAADFAATLDADLATRLGRGLGHQFDEALANLMAHLTENP